jgi:branched-chain amino acid transport system permease protein
MIGLVLLTAIAEALRDLLEWVPLIYGAILITILLFLPGGLISLPGRISSLVRKTNKNE